MFVSLSLHEGNLRNIFLNDTGVSKGVVNESTTSNLRGRLSSPTGAPTCNILNLMLREKEPIAAMDKCGQSQLHELITQFFKNNHYQDLMVSITDVFTDYIVLSLDMEFSDVKHQNEVTQRVYHFTQLLLFINKLKDLNQ